MATLADYLGVKKPLPGAEGAPNPDALAQLLTAQSEKTLAPNQAPDLTGYFDQLNTSRNPVHVAGIDEAAANEQKL